MIITIDGPASVGKGTLAKKLAEFYGLAYFDTGIIYRATTLEIILQKIDIEDEKSAEKVAKKMSFEKMMSLASQKELRGVEVSRKVAIVASYKGVRELLLKMQREFAKKPVLANGGVAKGVVYDGRDTGTVVMPYADLKFFVTASSEIRAERRWKEFSAKKIDISYEDVLEDIKKRDEMDMKRTTSPLKPAEDAITIDTSDLSAFEVFEKVCDIMEDYI